MKKSITILLVVVLILMSGIIYFISNKATPVEPPERLANIPKQAKWVGGADGGTWYQITKVLSKNSFKIKLYYDGNGELAIDTIFTLNSDCPFKEIDSTTLVKSINAYDGEKILLTLPEEGKRCSLIIE